MVSTENGRTRRGSQSQAKNAGSREKNAGSPEWMRALTDGASSLEHEIEGLLQKRPLATVGGALALGLAGFFLVRRAGTSSVQSKRNVKAKRSTEPGLLASAIEPALERIQDQFDQIGFQGLGSAGKDFSRLVRTELKTRPWQTIGAAVALGYGLGSADREGLKRGAVRLVQSFAVQSLERLGGSEASTHSQTRNLEGANDEYDPNHTH